MAQESCNLDKDEAEVLKPTSSSSSPTPTTTTTTTATTTATVPFLKPCEEIPATENPERPAIPVSEAAGKMRMPEKEEEMSSFKTTTTQTFFGNRCSLCSKKVRLTGFRCRCGDLFCPRHRHSEMHDCTIDYKTVGREEIARANPVVRAAKIIKI